MLLILLATVLQLWIWAIVLAATLAAAGTQTWFTYRAHELGNIAEVDSLSGIEFERWLGHFFERLGFDVERTPYRGDFGADLVLSWRGIRIAVQAKSGHFNAGVSAVQEALAGKAYYGCERAYVVSTRYFTDAAVILADSAGVELRSRDDLARKLAELKGQ